MVYQGPYWHTLGSIGPRAIHLYVNLKREREARTWKIKQTIFYCMYSISAWARRERETRIYDRWPCDASVKPIATDVAIFHVHAQHSRARNTNKLTSLYVRGNRETN